jgi:hypothetical protein
MLTCIALALTCWLCAFVASPRKPLPGTEVQELVYVRLLGRWERVVLLAVVMTIVAFASIVAAVPERAGAEIRRLVPPSAVCTQLMEEMDPCLTIAPGTRAVGEIQDNGKAAIVSTYVPSGPKTQ